MATLILRYEQKHMKRRLSLLLLGAFLVCTSARKGVSPEDVHRYDSGQNPKGFSCGSKVIPWSAVNDNYCDCPTDAEYLDEPGTAACATGKFYCKNKGHIGRSIPSSRVHDGICDCCDGSDEASLGSETSTLCPDTCPEENALYEKDRQEKRALWEAGSRVKREYVEYGVSVKESWEAELKEAKTKLIATEGELAKLTTAKEAAEKLEKELQGMIDQKAENECPVKFEAIKAEYQELHQKVSDLLTVQLPQLQGAFDSEEATVDTLKTTITEFIEWVDMERETLQHFPDEIVTSMKDGGGELKGRGRHFSSELKDIPVKPLTWQESLVAYYDKCGQPLVTKIHDWFAGKFTTGDIEGARKAADAARTAFSAVQASKAVLDSQISGLENKLGFNYGEKQEFAKLADVCINFTAGEYIYEACPFRGAAQKDSSGNRISGLGTWSDWPHDSSADYSVFRFVDGDQCWNGPRRSLTIRVECGPENEILSAYEPSKCEYHMEMRSPALCPDEFKEQNYAHTEL